MHSINRNMYTECILYQTCVLLQKNQLAIWCADFFGGGLPEANACIGDDPALCSVYYATEGRAR